VRPSTETISRQRLAYFVGISEATVGVKRISINFVVIPPGGAAEPHLQRGDETAVSLIKGRVELRYGPELRKSIIVEEGDFIFIPPDVIHQPINLSQTEPAYAIAARDNPNEQEHVFLHDPDTDPSVS
jgi:Predicted mannose-6-phosphate isomerase